MRYLLTLVYASIVVFAYNAINIKLFSLDITKQTRNVLFSLFSERELYNDILFINTGTLSVTEVSDRLETVLSLNPRVVGVNLCHYSEINYDIINRFKNDARIIFANCDEGKNAGSLSRIIGEGNTVTHFKTDRNDYFELKLAIPYENGKVIERINYKWKSNFYSTAELRDSDDWYAKLLNDKIIVIGYLGDYRTDSIYNHINTRKTPLNKDYGQDYIIPDMYDTEIIANVISTINNADFLIELGITYKVIVLLLVSVLNVIGITYIRTKFTFVNILIASILFILLTMLGTLVILFSFHNGYILDIDELPLVLLITTFFTVFINLIDKKTAS